MPPDDRPKPDLPTGAFQRLGRVSAAAATLAGRTVSSRVRKWGADEEARGRIDRKTHEDNAATLFHLMTGLKGAPMKLGQLLTQQPGSLPEPYVEKLASLQWEAPPMHGTLARLRVRRELEARPEDLFAQWEHEPFAAASLGQVHRARLRDGTPLAVKVQYPGIERSLETDFAVLAKVLGTLQLGAGQLQEVRAALEEVREHVLEETNYVREAEHQEAFRKGLAGSSQVVIPRVVGELSTRRILTMERLEGVHVRGLLARGADAALRDRLGTILLALFLDQTLKLGRLHADAHPGNFLFLPDGRVGLLDFGCVKCLSEDFARDQAALLQTPPDRIDELDVLYLRLGFYRPEDPRAAEKRQALLELQKADMGPFHRSGPVDFSEAGYVRGVVRQLRQLLRLGVAHRELVLYARAKVGLYSLLHRLGARVDGRALLEERL